jgi:hypothetical protein
MSEARCDHERTCAMGPRLGVAQRADRAPRVVQSMCPGALLWFEVFAQSTPTSDRRCSCTSVLCATSGIGRTPISRLHYNSGRLAGRVAGNVPKGSV